MSGCILHLSILHSPVFLLNSCLDRFSAPPSLEDPLSRSYRVSLPSSLTVIHSSALVYSTRLRVSVCGTGAVRLEFSGFSRRHGYLRSRLAQKGAPYFQVRIFPWICLRESAPTPLNPLFRQGAAVSQPRHRVTPDASNGMLTVCPSASPCG